MSLLNERGENYMTTSKYSRVAIPIEAISSTREQKMCLEREFMHIRAIFPESQTEKLYELCEKNGFEWVLKQYLFSREALAIIINGYIAQIAEQKKEEGKKPVKIKSERIFSKNEIISDIKQSKKSNTIIVFYANGNFEKFARNRKNYNLVKEQILEYGKHIILTVEENILSTQDKKKINKLDEKQRSNALIRKVKNERRLLMEERQLYMKWKFFFDHRDIIESIQQYETSEDLKMILRHRNISFQKLNSFDYTYKNVVEDYEIAAKIYNRIQENEEELVKTLGKLS